MGRIRKRWVLYVLWAVLVVTNACNRGRQTDIPIRTLADFYETDSILDQRVDFFFRQLTDEQRIAQMMWIAAGSGGKSLSEIQPIIRAIQPGGIIFVNATQTDIGLAIAALRKEAIVSDALPMWFFSSSDPFSQRYWIKGELTSADDDYDTLPAIYKRLRLDGNFAPWTSEPDVQRNVERFIETFSEQNISTVYGAFPYIHTPGKWEVRAIDVSSPELRVPENAVLVQMSLAGIPANDFDDTALPASMSRYAVTGLLKEQLKFEGLVVSADLTDPLLNNFTSPALNSVKAGCDLIVFPFPESRFISTVKTAINEDEELKAQVYASVRKILRLKICLQAL